MAKTVIQGNIGKHPPKMRESQKGTPYVTFSVGWSESQRDGAGQWVDGPTMWVQVKAFGKQAQNIADSLGSGDRVVVAGELRPEEWNSNHGAETVLAMLADQVAVSLVGQTATVQRVKREGSPWPNGQAGEEPPF